MKYLLTYILIFWASIVFAQEPYTVLLNSQQGLPSDIVYNTHQDVRGFIWIATNEGLIKYDGFNYKIFRSSFLTSAPGSVIKEDKYGRIWYENFDGFIYYVENDTLKELKQNDPSGFVNFGLTDKYLFVIQKKGIDIYNLKSLTLLKTIVIDVNEAEHATTLNNNFYCIIDHVIYKVDNNLKLTKSNYFIDKLLKVKYIFPYKDELYIVSKNNESKKLYFFNQDLSFQNSINISDVSYIQGSDVSNGLIWIHTPKGIFSYTKNGLSLYKNGLYNGLSTTSLIKDHQNNYWISTLNKGIIIIPEIQDRVYSMYPFNPLKIITIDNQYIMGDKKGNILLLSTDFKIKKKLIQDKENLPINYIFNDTISENIFYTGSGFSIALNNSFTQIQNYNIALKEITRLDQKYYAIAASGFCGLFKNPKYKGNSSSIWDTKFNEFQDKDMPSISRIKKAVRAKAVDFIHEKNSIVFATNIGLYKFTPVDEKEILYRNKPIYADRILAYGTKVLILDTKRNLLSINEDESITNVSEKWNLPENDIRKIKKSKNHIILITSEFIYTYDIKNDKISKIDFHIKGDRINDIELNNDYLVALTNEGVLKIPVYTDRRKKEVFFKINDVFVNNDTYSFNKKLVLNYDENDLKINFSVLEYSEIKTPIYYRINKNEWILINPESRTLQFPSLSPGIYNIEFLLNGKIQTEKIFIEIVTPFWKKWWFYTLLTLSISTLLWFYFNWQSKLMKNQIDLLNEKVSLEKSLSKSMMASIKSQMNPHFFYNALNTIQAYIFTNDKVKANAYLAKFSKLTRSILEMSEKETISLSEEIRTLNLYLELEKMRFTDSFIFKINTRNISDLEAIEIPPMIIQPYVENAIKHGLLHRENEKILHIDFEVQTNILKVIIDDNGIGRKRSQELNQIKNSKHKSFSTQANEKRLEILNRGVTNKIGVDVVDKINNFNDPAGTTVILHIPI